MKNTTIDEAAREERRLYLKEWRAKNKDKVRQHNATYWQRRAERILREQERGTNHGG